VAVRVGGAGRHVGANWLGGSGLLRSRRGRVGRQRGGELHVRVGGDVQSPPEGVDDVIERVALGCCGHVGEVGSDKFTTLRGFLINYFSPMTKV
jgi:hypothetical protein